MSYSEITLEIMKVIRQIPYGKVSSYGAIARQAGYPNGARQVVRVLHALSEKENLPWYRVVNKKGQIALEGDGAFEQLALLAEEGVSVTPDNIVKPEFFHAFLK